MTLKVRKDVPSLRSVALLRELERSFAVGCERGDFRLVHYVLLDDHVHLLVEARDARALAGGMKALGARLARAVNRVFGRRGAVLAERYHHVVLRTPAQVRNALRYVLLNARRHARRVTRARRVDPASSGRWFDGWARELEGAPEGVRPPVAAGRSWLLRWGWRRLGLIDPDDVPGGRRRARPG